jgi:hypothetical protein
LRVFNARAEVYKKVRSLAHELQISFIATILPVYTIPEGATRDKVTEDGQLFPTPFYRDDGFVATTRKKSIN